MRIVSYTSEESKYVKLYFEFKLGFSFGRFVRPSSCQSVSQSVSLGVNDLVSQLSVSRSVSYLTISDVVSQSVSR